MELGLLTTVKSIPLDLTPKKNIIFLGKHLVILSRQVAPSCPLGWPINRAGFVSSSSLTELDIYIRTT